MRVAPALLFALVSVSNLASQATGPAAAKINADLTALFGKVVAALRTRDTMALRSIYAENYQFTVGGGDSVTSLTRAERLQSVAASPDSITDLNLESCQFKPVGAATAVGGCWIRQRSMEGRQDDWVGIYSTVVFVKNPAGRWRLAVTHASVNRPKRR